MTSVKDQIDACLQHYFGCQEREDMTDEQLAYIQSMIEQAAKQLGEIFEGQK